MLSRTLAAASLLVGGGILLMTSLRSKTSPAVQRLIDQTEAELNFWQSRNLKESQPVGIERVKLYWWQGVGIAYPGVETPWSAAFISYVANKANPNSLPPSPSHLGYAAKAKQGIGKFRLIAPQGIAVRPGDILLRTRGGSSFRFEDIGGPFVESHSDIVTRIEGGSARAIGGNKANDVSVEQYALQSDGSLADRRVVAILRLSA